MVDFNFEKLEVWQMAIDLCQYAYRITAKFPDEEKYGLTQQLRRATVSVASNIAEGSGRVTLKDKTHFINMAFGSLMEAVAQMHIAHRVGYADEDTSLQFKVQAKALSGKLNAYAHALGHPQAKKTP